MNFLKNVLAVILGFFISVGIIFVCFLVLISVVSASFSSSYDSGVSLKENSVLTLEFKKTLTDYSEKIYFEDFDHTLEEFNGLNSILSAIEKAKTDPNIKGIYIKSSGNISGIALARAVRFSLEDFKKSGKFVLAYNDIIEQSDYYLQSVADAVYTSPVGELSLRGLSSQTLFFKGIQEKTGIKMEVIRHGKYKSAVEPFLSDKMSAENREQISELLQSVWGVMAADIAQSRQISVDTLNAITHRLGGRTPKLALENKLIDGILFRDEFEQILCEKTASQKISDLNFINIDEYAEKVVNKASAKKITNSIAVIYAEGEIRNGKGTAGVVGDETIIEAIRQAVDNQAVTAIILRVNSPGGSALASELIHREIEIAKRTKKVYVSMGNYAASGGYYIACGADRIFADKATITGSIGVFGMLPNVSKLAENIGINAEQVTTHKHSAGYSLFEKPSESFIKETTESVENIYNLFVERVADGRKMTTEQVNAIAQGRVWSGQSALENGLVDEIGTLNDVISFVAKEHHLTDYGIKSYPIYKTSLKDFFKGYAMSLKIKWLQNEIGDEAFSIYQEVKKATTQKGVQATLPFKILID